MMQQQTSGKVLPGVVATGTVLCVKRYPCDEIAVKIHDSPAVLTLRDVDLLVSNVALQGLDESRGAVGSTSTVRGSISHVQEGMQLVLHCFGVWNVNTTAFHGSKVMLDKTENNVAVGWCGSVDKKPCNSGVSVLPQRRKHIAMSKS